MFNKSLLTIGFELGSSGYWMRPRSQLCCPNSLSLSSFNSFFHSFILYSHSNVPSLCRSVSTVSLSFIFLLSFSHFPSLFLSFSFSLSPIFLLSFSHFPSLYCHLSLFSLSLLPSFSLLSVISPSCF